MRILKAAYANFPPPFLKRDELRGRRRLGVKYEAAGQRMLKERFGDAYLPSPWLRYTNDSGEHWCQPDGILCNGDSLLLVEFKYQHTIDAWRQLRWLYQPVVEALHPGRQISVLEIVKWYDPLVAFPEPVQLIADISRHTGPEFGVHIWRP